MAPVRLLISVSLGPTPIDLNSMQIKVVLPLLPVSAYLAMKKLQYMESL